MAVFDESLFAKDGRRKKQALESLSKHMGIVSHACKEVGMNRRTFYYWKNDDPAFKSAIEEVEDESLDEIESVAQKMIIEEHNAALTIFYLKTKGRKRGYVEKQEVEISCGDLKSLRDTMNDVAKSHEKDY